MRSSACFILIGCWERHVTNGGRCEDMWAVLTCCLSCSSAMPGRVPSQVGRSIFKLSLGTKSSCLMLFICCCCCNRQVWKGAPLLNECGFSNGTPCYTENKTSRYQKTCLDRDLSNPSILNSVFSNFQLPFRTKKIHTTQNDNIAI